MNYYQQAEQAQRSYDNWAQACLTSREHYATQALWESYLALSKGIRDTGWVPSERVFEESATKPPAKRIIRHAGNLDLELEVIEVGRWRYGSRSEIALAFGNGDHWYVGDLIDEKLYSPNIYGDESTARRYFVECIKGDR